jgi:prespore-specific regulator
MTTIAKQRQDAWMQEDDKVLVDSVLRHIREGSTQLAAFDEAAERLERTSAACGFRWNAALRKRYEHEIKEAKSARQTLKGDNLGLRARVSSTKQADTEILVTVSQLTNQTIEQYGIATSDFLDQIISLAQTQKRQMANMAKQIKSLNEQLSVKETEIERLRVELDEARSQPSEITVNEDYRTLLEILQRARQIGAIDEGDKGKPVFKMDSKGNIEMIG